MLTMSRLFTSTCFWVTLAPKQKCHQMNNRNDREHEKLAKTSGQTADSSRTAGHPGETKSQAKSEQSKDSSKSQPNFRRKRGSFATMSNLMNKLVVKLGLDQRLKEHALMDLWPTIVGEPFSQKSRCIFIDSERKLVVSVQDASVGQELSLLRRDLVRKMQSAANGLGVKIDGIRFDMKHFYQGQSAQADFAAQLLPSLPKPSAEDLQSVTLTVEELDEIRNLRLGTDATGQPRGRELREKLRINERVSTIFEHELRLRKWRLANGYPVCLECAEPAAQLHGSQRFCSHCFYKAISPKSI